MQDDPSIVRHNANCDLLASSYQANILFLGHHSPDTLKTSYLSASTSHHDSAIQMGSMMLIFVRIFRPSSAGVLCRVSQNIRLCWRCGGVSTGMRPTGGAVTERRRQRNVRCAAGRRSRLLGLEYRSPFKRCSGTPCRMRVCLDWSPGGVGHYIRSCTRSTSHLPHHPSMKQTKNKRAKTIVLTFGDPDPFSTVN